VKEIRSLSDATLVEWGTSGDVPVVDQLTILRMLGLL
jgi:hypothetical protein